MLFEFSIFLSVLLSLSLSCSRSFSLNPYFILCVRLPISIYMMYEYFVCVVHFRLHFGLYFAFTLFLSKTYSFFLIFACAFSKCDIYRGRIHIHKRNRIVPFGWWSALFVSKERAKAKIKIKINTIAKQQQPYYTPNRENVQTVNKSVIKFITACLSLAQASIFILPSQSEW